MVLDSAFLKSPGNDALCTAGCLRGLVARAATRTRRGGTATSLRQSEHEQLVSKPGLELRRQADEAEREPRAASARGDVLLAADGERDRVAVHGRAEIDLPE